MLHVVGARPNFVKAAPVLRAMAERGVEQLLLHTGQHSDPIMSEVFFRDLQMPAPDIELRARSGSPAKQLASMMVALEREMSDLMPQLVVVYGDVNSTLAAALMAANLKLPLAHVEAGLRSFDLTMPEEINRRVVDVLSDVLFATVPEALENLAAEGVDRDRVHHVGNPMIDSLAASAAKLDPARIVSRFGLPDTYIVATLHRQSNVDRAEDAQRAVASLSAAADVAHVVLPLHPRGRRSLEAAGLMLVKGLTVVQPLGYIDFLSLLRGAAAVVTDSGGVQEESTYLGVPCLTLRPNTERPSTVTLGTNRLVQPEQLGQAVRAAISRGQTPGGSPIPLWDGRAGKRIAAVAVRWLATRAG